MTKKVAIIGIAGGSASGKSTVANYLANVVLKDKSVIHLCMDSYYKKFSDLMGDEKKSVNYDHPDSIDINLLIKDLKTLKSRKSINVPIYDFTISDRTEKTYQVEPADVIILDGFYALGFKELLKLIDIKIFINTSPDIRFIRRLQRDTEERGRTINDVIEQYLRDVKPMHDIFVEPTIKYADIIIPYYDGNPVALDMVATKILDLVE